MFWILLNAFDGLRKTLNSVGFEISLIKSIFWEKGDIKSYASQISNIITVF